MRQNREYREFFINIKPFTLNKEMVKLFKKSENYIFLYSFKNPAIPHVCIINTI